ncbi:MAG: hypothetical protein HZA54_16560, partial [Planctomycetes bacterium]|nr:hypothetical protein [Planctomycetota bacterium]
SGGTLFEDWDAKKATPRRDTWAGKAVQLLAGQVWVCWEKAPLDRLYYSEIRVAGGAQKYDHLNEGPAPARDRFPDQVEASGHANVFVLPFDWPEGHVGRFTLTGTIYALPKEAADAGWKTAPGVEKFEFTEPFEIPDQRAATDADLVVKYSRKLTVAEIAACAQLADADKQRYTQYAASGGGTANVELYQPFDFARADLWGRKWGDAEPGSVTGITFELHVRWKEAPPDAVYFYDCTVRGGVPAFEETETGNIAPRDEFPPAPYKAGAGSNAFIVRLPNPLWRGGRFEVSGTLYALPKKSYSGETWRQEKPLASVPLAQRLELRNLCRFAKGTVRVNEDASIDVMVLLAYVQRGRRVARLTAGGKTIYQLIDESYYSGGYFPDKPGSSHWVNVDLPLGAAPPSEAEVSFLDFGERVTLTVPLAPEAPPGDVAARRARIAENEQKSLAKIAGWMKAEEGNLDPLRREYLDLAGWYRTLDYGKWSEYARHAAAYDERYYRKDLATTREEYKQQTREILAGVGESLYWGAVEWGFAGEAEGAFAAAAAKIQGAGLPAGLVNGRLHGLYRNHAESVVKLTGDLDRATALWKQSEEYRKGASGGIIFAGSGEPVCPYTIDASFREAR